MRCWMGVLHSNNETVRSFDVLSNLTLAFPPESRANWKSTVETRPFHSSTWVKMFFLWLTCEMAITFKYAPSYYETHGRRHFTD